MSNYVAQNQGQPQDTLTMCLLAETNNNNNNLPSKKTLLFGANAQLTAVYVHF